jgi:hypothetical protein
MSDVAIYLCLDYGQRWIHSYINMAENNIRANFWRKQNWWAVQDSNLRPSRCKRDALTN